MDGQRPFAAVPERERRRQGDGEHAGGDRQRNAEVVDQIVGGERADHADQHDGQPVDLRNVAPGPELPVQGGDQAGAHDQRRPGQPEAEMVVEEVGGGLADRGGQDLDDPEEDRDLGDLVQHRPGPPGRVVRLRRECHGGTIARTR